MSLEARRGDRRPHILVVVPRIIYPASSGGELRIYSLLRCLSDRYRLSMISFVEPGDKTRGLAAALKLERDFLNKVHCIERDPGRSRGIGPGLPARNYESAEMAAAIKAAAKNLSVDLVHFEFSEMAQYAKLVGGELPVVLTEHDTSLFSSERSYLRQPRSPIDIERQRRYEIAALRHCDRVVTVSNADRRRLQGLIPAERVKVVPTGVDLSSFAPTGGQARPNTLIFIGHYLHYPNEDAAIHFCRDIMPLIQKKAPRARLRLVGSGLTNNVRALASSSVQIVGAVSSVQPYLAQAAVFVAPVRLGHGIKGKLLEAFAAGVPVVANAQSCEGVPQAKHEEHLLIAKNPEMFAEQVCRLLREPQLRRRLAANARALVEKSFQWKRQADRLDRVYQSLLRSRV